METLYFLGFLARIALSYSPIRNK
ncbi:hypothetical protein BVIET440_30016 [Burkholderia vietnamiensis]|nr:hypothetical protein BVI2075_430015 [Burkholderia vietnamiensis]